jgi:UDP-N-acetylglucosamine--N-acetylmuramyl-(pentapeptide) pyrophosphoryl-undecaprenol N-acetylglucosamine transferase
MKVLFSGGGTLGPVTPLLAIHDVVKDAHTDAQFFWVGTMHGPEQALVKKKGITFFTLNSGKFRRYISFWNIIDMLRILIGFFQSIPLLLRIKPDICISAGGYVSVPLHWAAWILGIPSWIHQQDVHVGLSNKLMSPFATKITTSLESQVKKFKKKNTTWLGNPVRKDVVSCTKEEALTYFNNILNLNLSAQNGSALGGNLPVVFATGGGTGSMRVNELVTEAVQHLSGYAQVIHLSGLERPQELVLRTKKHFDYYHTFQFFTEEMKYAYAVADIVISRGGFGTLTELAALGKPAILIPKPGHQEQNVRFFSEAGAVVLVSEKTADGNYLAKMIRDLIKDKTKQKQLGRTLSDMMPVAKKERVLQILDTLLYYK